PTALYPLSLHDALPISPLRQRVADAWEQLGKVALQRLTVATGDADVVTVHEDDGAEAVPLRLVEPALAAGNVIRGAGEHRGQRWPEGERGRGHRGSLRGRRNGAAAVAA